MIGYRFSTEPRLPERDMLELADALALQIHSTLGTRVYRLSRTDVMALIASYVDDLAPQDQEDVSWMVWHLFQDARELEGQG